MSKIVLNSRTKENFKIYVRKIESEYESNIMFPYWNCGYISIPVQNVKYIEDIYNLNVHGGITYTNYEKDNQFLVLGFDCAHYDDSPQFIKNPRSTGYCKNELINLSKQIKKQILNGRRRMIKNAIKAIKGLK